MEPNKLTSLDPNQIIAYTYDEQKNAQRVVIINENYHTQLNSEVSPPSNVQKIEFIEKPIIIKEIEYKEIQVPVILKETEYKEIQVPVMTQKIEFIEKPIIIKEIELREVRIPEFIKQIEIKEIPSVNNKLPQIQKICLILQTVFVFGLLLCQIFKH